MEDLFKSWSGKIPNYAKRYESLFTKLARTGTGTEEGKEDAGKLFSYKYELYIYAFFIGLYREEKIPLPVEKEEKANFSREIEHWGKNTGKLGRKNYTILQKYMFAALIAKTDVDFIVLEQNGEEIDYNRVVTRLRIDFEEYTNAGFALLYEQYEEDKTLFNNKQWFLENLISTKE